MIALKICVFALVFHTSLGGFFWYLVDIHYDPTYGTTSESCNVWFNDSAKGPYGHYECDSPWKLVDSAVRQMKMELGNPDFIVWGGDNGHHTFTQTTRFTTENYMEEMVANITTLFKQVFPGVPVVPVIGNHDWWPKNQLPENGATSDRNLYEKYYNLWTAWIPKDEESNFKKAGYYKVTLDDGRIIAVVLNTNLYLDNNQAANGDDPGGQFAWLVDKLIEARQSSKKVHLITHVLMGQEKMADEYNKKLAGIIRNHSDVLHASYAAHVHTDQFSLIFDKDGEAVAFQMMVPSVTPWRRASTDPPMNPTFRKFTYNDKAELTDWVQYYLDLPLANKGQSNWKKLYSAREAYGLQLITPQNLHSLFKELQNHGSTKWEEYYKNINANVGPPYKEPCDCECKFKELCSVQFVENSPYEKCLQETKATCGAASSQIMPVLSFVGLIMFKLCTV